MSLARRVSALLALLLLAANRALFQVATAISCAWPAAPVSLAPGGVGNVSMVSGALGISTLSGPSTVRGWLSLTLTEPAAAAGLLAPFGVLGLCHRIAPCHAH